MAVRTTGGNMDNIKNTILEFVEREYKLPENIDYKSFDYIENGYVDSMRLVQFVAILEGKYNIEFSKDELLSDDFRTIHGLEEMIQSKIGK